MKRGLYSSAALATVMVAFVAGSVGAKADVVQSGDIPGSWKVPGTNTSIRIAGTVMVDGTWDLGGATYTPGAGGMKMIQPNSTVPLNGTVAARQHGLGQIGAHNSSFQFYTSTPTDIGVIGTYFYADFYGASQSSVESSSNGGNLRMLYYWFTLGGWKVGQSWTEMKDPVSYTETINEAGSFYGGGMNTAVVPLIRYTAPTNILVPGEATASIEETNGEGDVAGALRPGIGNAGLGEYAYGVQVGDSQLPMKLPNLTLKYVAKPSWGRVGLAGNVHEIYIDGSQPGTLNAYYVNGTSVVTAGSGINNFYGKTSVTGYGFHPWFMLNNFWGKDQFDAHYTYGVADQTILEDSTASTVFITNPSIPGTALPAGFNRVGHINTAPVSSFAAQYEHWWTPQVRSVFNAAYTKVYSDQGIVNSYGLLQERQHVVFNTELIYSPVPSVTLGVAYDYMHIWDNTPINGQNYVAGNAATIPGVLANTTSVPKSQGNDNRIDFKAGYSF